MKIGFIGLGHMGSKMAARLLQSCDLTVYNRSSSRCEALVAMGARRAASVAEICESDLVFTMLSDDLAAEEVVLGPNGILENLAPGSVHVSATTLSVSLSKRLSTLHRERGQGYVAAPVFGRPEAAAAGKLFVLAAGEPAWVAKAQPYLDMLGQRTFALSAEAEKANLVKLCGNFMLAAAIESMGEAMALGEKGGVARHLLLDILTSTLFDLPIYKNYGALIADRRFEPAGFSGRLGQKDIRLVLEASEELLAPLPVASILRDRLLALVAQGGGELDWSAMGSLAAKDAGL